MAKKNELTDDFEREEKKRIIERLLMKAYEDLGSIMPKLTWLPKRRYLQRVLWSLSLTELQQWKPHDSYMLILELQMRDTEKKR